MNRREFLRRMGLATAAAGVAPLAVRGAAEAVSARDDKALNAAISATPEGKMATRPFGKLGVSVGILGFGGGYVFQPPRKQGLATIRRFVECGGNYIDTASQYGAGKSEDLIGEAIEGDLRKKVFLATKILQRSHAASTKEFDESLKRLRVPYVDLLQVHAVNSQGDFDAVFGKEGSLRTAIEAQKAGKTRFVGITGHTRPAIILKALSEYDFDSVLVPVGVGDTAEGDFWETVLPVAREKKIATVGMKLLGMKAYLDGIGVPTSLRYSLNLDIDVGIVGFSSPEEVDEGVAAARDLKPVPQTEVADSIAKAATIREGGALWWKRT